MDLIIIVERSNGIEEFLAIRVVFPEDFFALFS